MKYLLILVKNTIAAKQRAFSTLIFVEIPQLGQVGVSFSFSPRPWDFATMKHAIELWPAKRLLSGYRKKIWTTDVSLV